MNKVWKNLNGYAIICVSGFGKERFINLCKNNGVPIWDLKYDGKDFHCCAYYKDRAKLSEIAEKTGCKCKVSGICGLPVFLNICKRHIMFIAGYISFIILIKYATSFVWHIDIKDNNITSDNEILTFCSENGLYTGAHISDMDYKELSQKLRDKFEKISWANISSKGTLVVIKTAQSGESADVAQAQPPSDIVADSDCVITEIIALKGMPKVKAGDSVQKGDTLVSGTLVPVGFEENKDPSYTSCEAKIRGKCVENKKIAVPLQYTEKKYTDKKYTKNSVIFFNKKFNTIFSKNEPKYKKYDIMEEIEQLKTDEEHPLPVFICSEVYREYMEVKRTLTEEEAKNKAASELIDYIVESYPLSSDIISTKLDFEIEKGSVILNAEIVSERDIGMSTPLTPQEEQDVNGTAENTNSQ